ncbi:MAG: zeta toxin family protein [Methylococcaceae bacterium]
MNNNKTLHIDSYTQLKKLRTALAIAQGMKLLAKLQQEAEDTVSHDQAQRVTYLTGLFSRIHRELFHDWKEQATIDHRPGTMTNPDNRKAFRETIEALVLNGNNDDNKDTALFDNNGFVIQNDNIATRLSVFYQKMRLVRPFSYGNRMTLDLFMIALANLPAFKAVYEQGIDFRRIEQQDAIALHDINSPIEHITLAFEHALNPNANKCLKNNPNDYGKWAENKRFVAGIPFLSHITAEGIECLVMVNGGLVSLKTVQQQFNSLEYEQFIVGRHLADYPHYYAEQGYLANTDSLRIDKTEIDGIDYGENGCAPLFCLDVNILTGLRAPAHTELLELIKQCTHNNAVIFDLANNETLKATLLNEAQGDQRLTRGVEIAYQRLNKITQKLELAKQRIFADKTSVTNPQLFMCMGGAGSGKTAVEEIAKAHCDENYVIASLDEFRKVSELYQVLTAANHHSDDYVFVEPFANRLRSLIAEQAKTQGFNILYDGTGIPYQPRYATIIKQFKTAGFHTQITAVDAFLVKPQGRDDELPRSAVVSSVKARYQQTQRALPWVVTVDKHIRAPNSFLTALQHDALEKLSLFANDGERNRHYLVAESFAFDDDGIRALQRHQLANCLLEYFKRLIRTHKHSILRQLAKDDERVLEGLLARNPAFTENNIAYQIYPSNKQHRVLVIYNTRRMADFIQKRQLNPNASGETGLLHKPEALAFHIDPAVKEPWLTRLQD